MLILQGLVVEHQFVPEPAAGWHAGLCPGCPGDESRAILRIKLYSVAQTLFALIGLASYGATSRGADSLSAG